MEQGIEVGEFVSREEAERMAREHYLRGWEDADDSHDGGPMPVLVGMVLGASGAGIAVIIALLLQH